MMENPNSSPQRPAEDNGGPRKHGSAAPGESMPASGTADNHVGGSGQGAPGSAGSAGSDQPAPGTGAGTHAPGKRDTDKRDSKRTTRRDEISAPTRTGVIWFTTAIALILLILLIIFILQNPDAVAVRYFGFEGSVPLGMALFIAAVAGGVLVAIAGVARVAQLRMKARRARRSSTGS